MPSLSVLMPYYRNPLMLARHLLVWRDEWRTELKRDIEIVIVDDGSPAEAAADVLSPDDRAGLPPLSLYRVTVDRPWHQHGARNLAAHVAAAPWLLMTDMDHVIPAETLRVVLDRVPAMREREVLTFGRVDAPETPAWRAADFREFALTRRGDGSLKPHVNSFVVNRARYWRLGGYDEDLCGVYGTDKHFRDRLFGFGAVTHHLAHAPLIRVDCAVIADASTRDVERKVPGRAALKRAALARKPFGQTTTLNFPWKRIL